MVQAVREGESVRSVARCFGVSHATVLLWVKRARGRRLDRVDWSDRASGSPRAWNCTTIEVEQKILAVRRSLKDTSALGEYGAQAIAEQLKEEGHVVVPSIRTIGRVLKRHGVLDRNVRVRRPAPPRGWYLPEVAQRKAELDSFDVIEDLKIEDGPLLHVLTGMSLHGRLAVAWPAEAVTAKSILANMLGHWRMWGRPAYAQFDNDARFHGAHHPDSYGRIQRLCLQIGVTPVFAPPNETGFQAAIESFNGLWQTKVWQRCRHVDLEHLRKRNALYLEAHRKKTDPCRDGGPSRSNVPADFELDLGRRLSGKAIYIRRVGDEGQVKLQGHTYPIEPNWANRLVRCEILFDEKAVEFFALRRRDPNHQPLLKRANYSVPDKPFIDS